MIKTIAFLFAFLPSVLGYQPAPNATTTCACSSVTNVQRVAQSSGTNSYTWTAATGASQYKVWYKRLSNCQTSSESYTSNTSFTFSGLAGGEYTFYFAAVCIGEESNIIGIDDMTLN
jgi:hypothetical protein